MPTYKLTYFGSRARGEVPRQLLHLAGQPFEDYRVDKTTQWPDIKPTTPFGQLPVLSVDGKQLAQSAAIVRYLANKFGFAGKDDWEAAQVDALNEQLKDYMTEIRPAVLAFNTSGDVKKIVEDVLPARDRLFSILKKRLADNKSGWLVGDGITYVDLHLAELMTTSVGVYADFLKGQDEIAAHQQRVQNHPKLKDWIEKRPKTQF